MAHRYTFRNTLKPLCLFIAMMIVGGSCNTCPSEHGCQDIPRGAIPQPCGVYMCRWEHTMENAADRDLTVIYRYEWSADPTRLTPAGQDHLYSLARQLCCATGPIVIETSDDAQLDVARRQAIMRSLGEINIMLTDRVVIGRSNAEGLYGQEAAGIAAHIIGNQTGAGAGAASQGGSSGGGQSGATGSTSGFGGFGGSSAGAGLGVN